MNWKYLHEKAVSLVNNLKTLEGELIETLQSVDQEKIYLHFDLTSTHAYCVQILKLTDSQAYTYIRVSRKASEVPELKDAVKNREIPISHAKQIASIITPQNQSEWIEKAKNLNQRDLEKEIKTSQGSTTKSFHCEVNLDFESTLRRIQDIMSQKLKKPVSRGEAIELMAKEYLHRHDPVQKAERALAKPARPLSSKTVSARTKHQVMKQTNAQCTYVDKTGHRCESRRWIDVHHIKPRSQDGSHAVSNLTVLCSAHHRLVHRSATSSRLRYDRRPSPGFSLRWRN